MTPDHLNALRGLAFCGGFLFFLCGELLRPYRPPTVPKSGRLLINLSLAALNAALLHFLFTAATVAAALYVTENHAGLLNRPLALPAWLRLLLLLLMMDFFIYIWHSLNHILPLLWRFHRVHHSDINMDVSTASRFHCGELAAAAVIKLGLVYSLGVDIVSLYIFDSILFFASQLNHTSIELPAWLEKTLWLLFVPPSMHRIHHSIKNGERNSNYGTILSLWDRIFGTLLQDIDQQGIVIGMGAYRDVARLNLHHLLWMPFSKAVK